MPKSEDPRSLVLKEFPAGTFELAAVEHMHLSPGYDGQSRSAYFRYVLSQPGNPVHNAYFAPEKDVDVHDAVVNWADTAGASSFPGGYRTVPARISIDSEQRIQGSDRTIVEFKSETDPTSIRWLKQPEVKVSSASEKTSDIEKLFRTEMQVAMTGRPFDDLHVFIDASMFQNYAALGRVTRESDGRLVFFIQHERGAFGVTPTGTVVDTQLYRFTYVPAGARLQARTLPLPPPASRLPCGGTLEPCTQKKQVQAENWNTGLKTYTWSLFARTPEGQEIWLDDTTGMAWSDTISEKNERGEANALSYSADLCASDASLASRGGGLSKDWHIPAQADFELARAHGLVRILPYTYHEKSWWTATPVEGEQTTGYEPNYAYCPFDHGFCRLYAGTRALGVCTTRIGFGTDALPQYIVEAVERGNLALLKEVKAAGFRNWNPLLPKAVFGKKREIATFVVAQAEFDADRIDDPRNQRNALHLVAQAGWADLIQEILRKSRDPRALLRAQFELGGTRELGGTPLHVAINDEHLEAVQALVEAGAPLDIVDGKGRTPLKWAELLMRESIASYLRERGAP